MLQNNGTGQYKVLFVYLFVKTLLNSDNLFFSLEDFPLCVMAILPLAKKGWKYLFSLEAQYVLSSVENIFTS